MPLVSRAGEASASRTVSVTRSGFLETQMIEMLPEYLATGLPLFMLEVFSLPSHSSVDSFGFSNCDNTELTSAATFVLGAAR